jgi:hypothetical protein
MRRNVPKSVVRELLRRAGYDVSRYSPSDPLQELLVSQRIDCVLDVGAFTGTTGLRLRTLGYAGPIVSFEPASATFEELSRTASGDPLWHVQGSGGLRARADPADLLARRDHRRV